MIATNSNCSKVGGCGSANPQGVFLINALKQPGACEIVFDHHPAFSDGSHGDSSAGKTLFKHTYNNRGELFLSGHDHNYQRFAPRRSDGTASATGVTQFVSGAGGKSLYGFTAADRTEYRQNTIDGALRLTLGPTAWTSQFINVNGAVMDRATGECR